MIPFSSHPAPQGRRRVPGLLVVPVLLAWAFDGPLLAALS